jgi:hypothetical protein
MRLLERDYDDTKLRKKCSFLVCICVKWNVREKEKHHGRNGHGKYKELNKQDIADKGVVERLKYRSILKNWTLDVKENMLCFLKGIKRE